MTSAADLDRTTRPVRPTSLHEQLVLDIDRVHSLGAVGLISVSNGAPDGGLLPLRTIEADAVVTEWLAYTHELEADRATLDDTREQLEECRTALTLVAASIPCAEAHLVPKVRELVGRNGAYRRAITNLEEVRAFAKDATAARVRGVLDVLKTSLAREARS